MKKRIVITGRGIVSPIGIGIDNFWRSLIQGKSGVALLDTFDTTDYSTKIAALVKDFDPLDFIDKKKVRKIDRFAQFGVAASKLAVQDAGLDFSKEAKDRVGVILGIGIGGLKVIEEQHSNLIEKGPRKVSPFLIPMLIVNIAPGEIAIELGVKGPNYSVSSACASASHAIGDAFRLLRHGDADVILAGGTEAAITPLGLAGFCSLKALSVNNDNPQKASRPFDKNRDGFVMGEGAGVLVLETLEHATKRGAKIYAELIGYGATDDAYHVTAPDPSTDASTLCIEKAIIDAEISKDDINYINAHGTSTYFNDKTETQIFKNVFGEKAYNIPISSTKSMTGHLLGAAGAVELIACVESINTGTVHPTINYEVKDPECDLDYVPNESRKNQIINVALSNSLGFGGHNAALIIKKFK
ncbi:beta-ketoacyl-ACP synthase II [bacterium]